jgi:alkanesulfonate monooxygenase SsuD/methylene tetrahydromethanopterin reductase-like flavin-dependent oxidoreductase (luciferase family)
MPEATLIPLGAWVKVLESASRTDGPLAFAEGPTAGPDAWTLATAVAQALEAPQILVVVDVDRRAPGLLAVMVATLDALSSGRLAVALGSAPDVEARRRRDEVRGIVDLLVRGETVDHAGPRYRLKGAAIGVRCVQQPRPPLLIESSSMGEWVEHEKRWTVVGR